MPLFSYKAIDQDGCRYTGRVERSDRDEAFAFVKALGYIPLEIKRVGILNADISELPVFRRRTGKKDIALFCRQLWFALDAGIEMTKAFQLLSRQALHVDFKRILSDLHERLLKGESLSDCMEKHAAFPYMLTGMVRVGELSGSLPFILEKMADYYEKEHSTSESLKSAMLYPLLVSVMMLGVIVTAIVFVVPSYTQIFMAGDLTLPMPTRLLIRISDFTRNYYIVIAVLILAAFVACRAFFKSRRGQLLKCNALLHLPLVKDLYGKVVNLRFAQTLSLMLDTGQQLVISLEAVKQVLNNVLLDDVIDGIIAGMEEGAPLWRQLEIASYFELTLCNMVQIGEETGRLADTMMKCVVYFQQETDMMLARLNKLVEPAITIVLGGLLAFIMLAIMMPTFSLVDIM